ncbi:HIT family protein [Actinomycetaceae bacterium TAE3-ERU4]|nr:HIT family protein [Actinomycetaceae bacterium TAE3-ERU4]
MSTIFEKIINREIPAEIVYEDDTCIVFLDIAPTTRGHVLVIPRTPVDQLDELDESTTSHIFLVAARFSRLLRTTYDTARSCILVAGYGVPHAHIHVFPTNQTEDINPNKTLKLDSSELSADAAKIRAALAQDVN